MPPMAKPKLADICNVNAKIDTYSNWNHWVISLLYKKYSRDKCLLNAEIPKL